MFLQAQVEKNRNRQRTMEILGQALAGVGQNVGQGLQQRGINRAEQELGHALNPTSAGMYPAAPPSMGGRTGAPPVNLETVNRLFPKVYPGQVNPFMREQAESMFRPLQEKTPTVPIWISPDMKNASMIEKPGFRKQMVPPGTIPQFMQKEEKPIIDKSMQAQIAKAKYEYAKVKPVATSISKEMDKLMELNKNSYGGLPGGMTVSILGKFDAKATDKYNNTLDLIKGMQQQVAKALKPSFGGQISEGERKYLNELYGALPGMGRVERERAMMKVKQIMETSIEDAKKTYEILSGENVGSMDRLDFGSKSVRDLSDAELEQLANGE